jgi:glycosyltransferase involved in cell wall biosynthesis
MTDKPKILYFVTEDWYFCSHRLGLAKAAQQAGFEVSVLTRVNQHADLIINEGMRLIPLDVRRGGINPLQELRTLWQIGRIYREIEPNLVHHVALKPVLYGSIVALTMPSLKVVNLLAGLGAIFSSDKIKARLLRPLVKLLLGWLLRRPNTCSIAQNNEDFKVLLNELQIPARALKLIKGSGVDTEKFSVLSASKEPITLALVSRLLWDKGVGEYVAAVKCLKQKGYHFDAVLVGKPDTENMASVCYEQLQAWQEEGLIRCLGHIENIPEFWRSADIAVLPSYREGLPKSLLEAAACGRPIVTTDTSGCKEVVDEGINGFLVPVRDVQALAKALEKLILDEQLRKKMGAAGRLKVEQEFSDAIVLKQTLQVYKELL